MLELFLRSDARFMAAVGSFCAVAAVVGLLLHLLYFIHGFRVLQVKNMIVSHLVGLGLVLAETTSTFGPWKGLVAYVAISSAYFAALFLSIVTYRLFFHPLRHFPGPFPAKITKLHTPWIARHGKLHWEYAKLHQRYGEFVRVGPNEISIVNPDAYAKVHGPQSPCSKRDTGIFDSLHYNGQHRLVSITDNAQHRKRRRIWDKSLRAKALQGYELGTRRVMHDWLTRLDEHVGAPIDTTLYAKLIALDNMGHIGFSTDFGTVREGRQDRMMHLLEITFQNAAMMGQLSWPQALIMDLPKFGMQKEFERLAVLMVDDRIKNYPDDKHDMLSFLLADLMSENPKGLTNLNAVYADCQSILSGSVHTTSCVLGLVFYYLARDAHLRQRVYDEIAPLHGRTIPGEFTASDLGSIELLDSITNEAMRMHSPAPLNGPRSVPPEGIEVDGTFLPGGINVFTPSHVYNISDKYYKQPGEFIPDRWTTRQDLVIDTRAFQPFGFGHYDCVAKRLAKNVLRLAVAYTLWKYDFEFAPGEDGATFRNNEVFRVILKLGSLKCVFTKRSRA